MRAGSCPLGKENYCFLLIVHFASLPQSCTRKEGLSKMEERTRSKIEEYNAKVQQPRRHFNIVKMRQQQKHYQLVPVNLINFWFSLATSICLKGDFNAYKQLMHVLLC